MNFSSLYAFIFSLGHCIGGLEGNERLVHCYYDWI